MDLAELGKAPIHPDRPAGVDVRYHPLFDQLQSEIDRGALPSVAGAVDWEKVVALSSDILSGISKDLLVAGYLAVGLMHTRKVAGVATGLRIYRDLLEHHGPNLFPQRERGRLLSVEWLKEKSEPVLASLTASPVELPQVASIEEDVEKLGELLAVLLPQPPSLQGVSDFLKRSSAADPPDAAGAVPEAESDEVPCHEAAAPPQAEQRAVHPAGEREAVDTALQQLRKSAHFLRELDYRNPLPYRLARQAAWLEVGTLPPASSGRTLLAPPSSALVERLAALKHCHDRQALLKEAEGMLHDFIFWLDLNRVSAEALAELEGGLAAASAIREETSFLLQRLAGLERLGFADGTPFADTATLQWLRKGSRGESEKVPADPPPQRAADQDALARETELAKSLLREGRVEEGVARLQDGVKRSPSERERLLWRIGLSQALLDAGHGSLALPHLEQVLSDIDQFFLEQYDPPLALEGLRLAWRVYDALQDAGSQEKAKQTLHRIGRLDLAEMVRLTR